MRRATARGGEVAVTDGDALGVAVVVGGAVCVAVGGVSKSVGRTVGVAVNAADTVVMAVAVAMGAAEEVAVAIAVLVTVGGTFSVTGGVAFSVTGGVAFGGEAVVLAVGVRGGALVIVAVTVAVGRCPSSSSEHPATAVNATAIANPRKIRLSIW